MQWTNQTAFSYVKKFLLKQGARSTTTIESDNGACAYRGTRGTMCAVGCLIPDTEYRFDFETKDALFVVPQVAALKNVDRQLLVNLQFLHDEKEPDEWREGFRHLAEKFKLKNPKVPTDRSKIKLPRIKGVTQ